MPSCYYYYRDKWYHSRTFCMGSAWQKNKISFGTMHSVKNLTLCLQNELVLLHCGMRLHKIYTSTYQTHILIVFKISKTMPTSTHKCGQTPAGWLRCYSGWRRKRCTCTADHSPCLWNNTCCLWSCTPSPFRCCPQLWPRSKRCCWLIPN